MANFGITTGMAREGRKTNTQIDIEHWLLQYLIENSGGFGNLTQIVDLLTIVSTTGIPTTSTISITRNGVSTPVNIDTSTPANNIGIPVELIGTTGTPINITAGDIDVHLLHSGTNPDSVQIGDGTTLASIIATIRSLKTDVSSVGGTAVPTKGSTPVVPMILLDGSGTQITSFGSVSVDDAAFTPASGTGTVIMGINTSDSVDAGDQGALAMTLTRELKTYDTTAISLLTSEPMLLHGNYSSPEDGTVAYTSSASVTCSNFPFTVDSSACNIIGIVVTNVSGAVTKYINGHNGISLSATSDVVSIIGATPFLVTDIKYRLVIHYQDKAYDSSTDTTKTSIQSWSPQPTSDPIPLIASAQTLTTGFVDLGFEIPCSGVKTIGLWLKLTIQQSLGVQILFLAKHTSAGTEEYYTPIETSSSTLTSLNPEYVQLPDASNLYRIKYKCDGVDQFVQVQCKMSTDGGTDGTIDTAYYTLGYI